MHSVLPNRENSRSAGVERRKVKWLEKREKVGRRSPDRQEEGGRQKAECIRSLSSINDILISKTAVKRGPDME